MNYAIESLKQKLASCLIVKKQLDLEVDALYTKDKESNELKIKQLEKALKLLEAAA